MTVTNAGQKAPVYILRGLRKKAGLTRKELADLAGVGKTTVFDIEQGKQSVQFGNVLKILRVLNVKIILQTPFGEQWTLETEDEKG
jgi:y4mF family transcriptional regulator